MDQTTISDNKPSPVTHIRHAIVFTKLIKLDLNLNFGLICTIKSYYIWPIDLDT